MAELKIYRGADRIGGGCTEITAGGKRVLIDFGANLPDTDKTSSIKDEELAARVFDGRPAAAVLFTHTHGDHIGLYKKVPPGVDMYVGPLAKEILRVLTARLDSFQFYHRTPRGKRFVCDSYQAQVMLTAMKGMEEKEPYWYRRSKYQPTIYIWRSSVNEDLSPLERLGASLAQPIRVLPADVGQMSGNGFVMLIRKSLPRHHQAAMNYFFSRNGGRDGYLTYSMWTGYLKGGTHPDQEMLDKLDKLGGIEPHPLHTSGHAYVDTIAELIKTVSPKCIVPMHTECSKEFPDFPEFARWSGRVRPLDNGEPLPLGGL